MHRNANDATVEDAKSNGLALNGHANGTKVGIEEADHGDSDEEDEENDAPGIVDGEGGE